MTDDRDYWEDDSECWNCGGDGFVYGCSWDWQCDTWDGDSCLCTRPCHICHPPKPDPVMQQVLADALARDRDGTEGGDAKAAPVPQDCQARAESIAPNPPEAA